MRCDVASGSDNDMNHVLTGKEGAVAVEADGFVRVWNVVEEGIRRKATAVIVIFALYSRESSCFVVLMNNMRLTLEKGAVLGCKEP